MGTPPATTQLGVADDAGEGDGYIYVDGETLAHTSMAAGVLGWSSNAPGADALALLALDGLAGATAIVMASPPSPAASRR